MNAPTEMAIKEASLIGMGIVTSVSMDLFGVPPLFIIWAMLGAYWGMGFVRSRAADDPAVSAKRSVASAAVAYISSSLFSGLIGHMVDKLSPWPSLEHLPGYAASFVFALSFQVLLSEFVKYIPTFFAWGVKWLTSWKRA